MDDIVRKKIDKGILEEGIKKLGKKIENEYGKNFNMQIVSSELTTQEQIPATFYIYKFSTQSKFGYYFFYVSNKSNKIILVSEFSSVKQRG